MILDSRSLEPIFVFCLSRSSQQLNIISVISKVSSRRDRKKKQESSLEIFYSLARVRQSHSVIQSKCLQSSKCDSEKVENSGTNGVVNLEQLSTPNDFVVFIFCAVADASPSKCAKVQQNSRRSAIIADILLIQVTSRKTFNSTKTSDFKVLKLQTLFNLCSARVSFDKKIIRLD